MKSRFFYGVFAGFILACLFFFGVSQVRAQAIYHYEQQAYEEKSPGDDGSNSIGYAYEYAAYNYYGADQYQADAYYAPASV